MFKMSTRPRCLLLLQLFLFLCVVFLGIVNAQTWTTLPSLETFATYEDMQRYFTQRNQRSFRHIGNPTDDSYLDAFNQYNEQLESSFNQDQPAIVGSQISLESHIRTKRSQHNRDLPTKPKFLKFEIEDAVEPSDEVKTLLRQHRARAEERKSVHKEKESIKSDITSTSTTSTVKPKISQRKPRSKSTRKSRRSKRSVLQQPANFQVKWIPFEASDAREPDESTKQLIKRMRALDIEQSQRQIKENERTRVVRDSAKQNLQDAPEHPLTAVQITPIQQPQISQPSVPQRMQTRSKPYRLTIRKTKRVKRETPPAQPTMIKFEISDAKSNANEKSQTIKPTVRESKNLKTTTEPTLLTMEVKGNKSSSTTEPPPKLESRSDHGIIMQDQSKDQNLHESKRLYIYKEAPALKTKKSLNTLPQEVQKVITHMFKDNQGGKAYVKYVPAQKSDLDHLKSHYSSKLLQPIYGLKLQQSAPTHFKYTLPKSEPQVHIQPVPVVEKLRFVYTAVPSYHQAKYSTAGGIAQPIIVPDVAQAVHSPPPPPPPTEIHHTYTAELAPPPLPPQPTAPTKQTIEVKNFLQELPAVAPFRASKPDPLLEETRVPDATSFVKATFGIAHIKPIEHYKYEIHSHKVQDFGQQQHQTLHAHHQNHQLTQQLPQAQPSVIKIEYHAPPDPLKDNYKNLEEFKELSTLIGKSPDDQIHGLTYLLAKEMQNKLQREAKKIDIVQRPQDNKAPILFHQIQPIVPQPNLKAHVDHAAFGSTKQYVPIVEHNEDNVVKAATAATEIVPDIKYLNVVKHEEPQAPVPSSFIEYGHGLSGGYEGINDHKIALKEEPAKLTSVEHVIHHHPTLTHHGHHGLLKPHYGLVGAHHQSLEALGSGEASSEHSSSNGVHYNINHHDVSKLQYASKYAFGYRIRDFHTGNDFGHKQNRDLNGVTRGQYHILLPDGRIQNVIYHADDTGFHADVSFESGH